MLDPPDPRPADSLPAPAPPTLALEPPLSDRGVPPLGAGTRETRQPIWPSLLALFAVPATAALASGITLALFVGLSSGERISDDLQEEIRVWIAEHTGTLAGVLVLILPGQLTMLVLVLLLAGLSGERPFRRLGLVRWNVSLATIGLVALGTLGIQWAVTLAGERLFEEPSETMRMIWEMVSVPSGVSAILIGLLISVLPALSEETLFRGFAQTRLLARWSPLLAIGMTSAVFAVSHFDVQQSLEVLPIGAWLGFVAWKTGSVWISVLCHFVNNFAAFAVGRLWGDSESGNVPGGAVYYAAGAVSIACTILAVRALLRARPRTC